MQTAHNRIINASPPDGGSGYTKQQSGDNALCAVLLRHNLPALVLLRKPLFGLANRRL
jgi:hypothetical protein